MAAAPVGANDVGRWVLVPTGPSPAARSLDADVAAKGPWGGSGATRDFDPFAWMPNRR